MKTQIINLIKEKLGVRSLSERMSTQTYKEHDMLLYLTAFGSHLYGTNTENSDADYKGIYRPSLQNLALGKVKKTLSFSTGDDNSKNTAEDIDVELFSLPYWLELLKKGETIALDLLFSFTNKDAVIYKDSYMGSFFNHTDLLVDGDGVKTCAYIRYAKSQSVKYGLKGTRMKALEKAHEFFGPIGTQFEELITDGRLSDYMYNLVSYVNDNDYCSVKNVNGVSFVYLCGKIHQSSITVGEFLDRVETAWKEYGHRAKKAMENEGVDWKAVSHCVRALHQTRELLLYGKITYPLKSAPFILDIKMGKMSWSEVERVIETGLDVIESMAVNFEGVWDQEFVDRTVLKIYDLAK